MIKILLSLFLVPLEWLVLAPLAIIIPRQKKQVVFIGKFNGQFVDNVKYLFLYAEHLKDNELNINFLTENRGIFSELKKNGIKVIFHPSLQSITLLLRAYLVIVDHNDWIWKCKYHLLLKAKTIQLWHGVGFKHVELEIIKSKQYREKPLILRIAISIYRALKGRFPNYDLIISTSKFYTQELFTKAFHYKIIVESGYPRNDVFFIDAYKTSEAMNRVYLCSDKTVINRAMEHKRKGKKIILYAPTYRDSGELVSNTNTLDIEKFDKFCRDCGFILIVKFHPYPNNELSTMNFDNVLIYHPSKDVYPLLPVTDLLITEYSSIYTDYLLLNKPIIFYPYDYKKYLVKDRELKFDYNCITPGPKCYSQKEIENEIVNILIDQKDLFKLRRKNLRDISFYFADGKSSERTWTEIYNQFYK
jgi:CDP-glycerol glycerophosphotransferase (TagB/SpsB family)